MGFRPLTGTLLSKKAITIIYAFNRNSFRPLTGTLLSKKSYKHIVTVNGEFPSPHGDSLI